MTEKMVDINQDIQELKESSQTILNKIHDVFEDQHQMCKGECPAEQDHKEIETLEAKMQELEAKERQRQEDIDALRNNMRKFEAALNELVAPGPSTGHVSPNPRQMQNTQREEISAESTGVKSLPVENVGPIHSSSAKGVGEKNDKPVQTKQKDKTPSNKTQESGRSSPDAEENKGGNPAASKKSHIAQSEIKTPSPSIPSQPSARENLTEAEDEDTTSCDKTRRRVQNPNFKKKVDTGTRQRKYRQPEVQHQEIRQNVRTSDWWSACKAEEKAGSKTEVQFLDGVHTILCVDISESMADSWSQVQTFVLDYIDGLEKLISEENFNEENVALVTFGHKTSVHVRSTKEVGKIRTAFQSITLGGPTPLFGGVLMAVCAAQSNSKRCHVNGAEIHKRIVLITDGHLTDPEMFAGPDVSVRSKQDEHVALLLDVLERFPQSGKELICVPVGNANMNLIDQLQKFATGRKVSFTDGTKLARRFYLTKKSSIGIPGLSGLEGQGGLAGLQSGTGLAGLQSGTDLAGLQSGTSLAELQSGTGGMLDLPDLSQMSSLGVEGMAGLAFNLQAHLAKLTGSTPRVSFQTSSMTGLSEEDQEQMKEIMESHKELTFESFKQKMGYTNEKEYEESDSNTLPKIGSRVRRGPDWSWKNQDSNGPGTVIGHHKGGGKVWVDWDANAHTNIYHYGGDNQYDVLLVDEPRTIGEYENLKTGCVVIPGTGWKYDYRCVRKTEEGVVIRLLGNRYQVKWANGYRGDYSYSAIEPSELTLVKSYPRNSTQRTAAPKPKKKTRNKNVAP